MIYVEYEEFKKENQTKMRNKNKYKIDIHFSNKERISLFICLEQS